MNKPVSPTKSYHRDGATRIDVNGEPGYHYHPNSFDDVVEFTETKAQPYAGTGSVHRYDHRKDEYKNGRLSIS